MKQYLFLIVLVFFSVQLSHGQVLKDFFFDEFQISLNKTVQVNTFPGIGLGAYHSFRPNKRFNLMFGVEYDRTSKFRSSIYTGRFGSRRDVTFNFNCFSVPVGFRLKIGSKVKFQFEMGAYAGLNVWGSKGTWHTSLPNSNSSGEFNEKFNLYREYGLYSGFGIRIPMSKYELIISPDYKLGLLNFHWYNEIYNRYFRLKFGLKLI